MAEIAARAAINAACFRGGNAGHLEQIKNKITMYNNCIEVFEDSNCQTELIKAMQTVVESARAVIAAAFAIVAVAAIIALIVAIIALIDLIVALVVAAVATVGAAAVITGAAATVTALLLTLQNQLGPGEPPDAPGA